jgi:tetratricopeptide (TPR) repeat protein
MSTFEDWFEGHKHRPVRVGDLIPFLTDLLQRDAQAGEQIAAALSRTRGTSPLMVLNLIGRADDWVKRGEFDRALSICEEAIRLDPRYADAYVERGCVWQHKGEVDRAIVDYETALRIDPGNASAFYNRGVAWDAKGETDRAVADYDTAIQLAEDPGAYNNRAYIREGRGEYLAALSDYTAAINVKHGFVLALGNRAAVLVTLGRNSEAIADLREALSFAVADADRESIRARLRELGVDVTGDEDAGTLF